MNERERRRREEEKAFAIWTFLTLWAVVGAYVLTWVFMLGDAYFQGKLP